MKTLKHGLILFASAFAFFLLMSKPGSCQGISVVTLGKDSFIVIPIDSAGMINVNYVDLDECATERDSLKSIVVDLQRGEKIFKRVVARQQKDISSYKTVVDNQQTIILNNGKSLDQWQGKYIRMVRWKNIEIVGVLITSGVLIWRITR